jgi:uncharacterized membrane protein YidH (DUF202 family)
VSSPPLFDPGLQPERTELAWRRTVLALLLGAVVSLRLLPPVLGPWSIGIGFTGVALAAATWALAARRSRKTRHALLGSANPMPDGGLLLVVALIVTGAAALGLTYVIASWSIV